jgi:hypothetical protein
MAYLKVVCDVRHLFASRPDWTLRKSFETRTRLNHETSGSIVRLI